MNYFLRNGWIDAHKLRPKEIASRHSRHGNELAILAVIAFDRQRQVHAVIHVDAKFEDQVFGELLRESDAGLQGVRIMIIRRSIGDFLVRLVYAWENSKR